MNSDQITGLLNQSLSALAVLAMRDANAAGFAYFHPDESGGFARLQGSGAFISEENLFDPNWQAGVSFPLRLHGFVDGFVAFVFPANDRLAAARPHLRRFIPVIEKVWAARSFPQTYYEILNGIIDLEAQLVDSKIASYAHGLLRNGPDEGADEAVVDAMLRHVESVLRPSAIMRMLSQSLEALREEVEERKWTAMAKEILQNSRGMSEQEAYAHLRKSSRQSRTRFIDVARRVVGGQM